MQNAKRLIRRQLIEATDGLTSLPGLGPPAILLDRQRAVIRHKHILDRDIFAAGAGEADHLPGIDDRVVARRQQEDARLRTRRWSSSWAMPPIRFHAAASTPLENGQRPVRR